MEQPAYKKLFLISLDNGIIWSRNGDRFTTIDNWMWGFTIEDNKIINFINELHKKHILPVLYYKEFSTSDIAMVISKMFFPPLLTIIGKEHHEVHERAMQIEICPKDKEYYVWDHQHMSIPEPINIHTQIEQILKDILTKRDIIMFLGNPSKKRCTETIEFLSANNYLILDRKNSNSFLEKYFQNDSILESLTVNKRGIVITGNYPKLIEKIQSMAQSFTVHLLWFSKPCVEDLIKNVLPLIESLKIIRIE